MIHFISTLFLSFFSTILFYVPQANAIYLPSRTNESSSDGTWNSANLSRRDVYSPPITSPREGDLWVMGSRVNVTWDTNNPPKQITNTMGELYLGNYSLGNEHLCMDRPLASNFDIRSGRVEVQVPDEFYCCYECILVLLGDSGNRSAKFKIASARDPEAGLEEQDEDPESLLDSIL